MTRGAFFRCGLIEEGRLARDYLGELVTLAALDALMRAPKRKLRMEFVIKERRLPLRAAVAFCATGNVGFGKLFSVNIRVALLALGRRGLEVHICQSGLQVRGLMTVDARRSAMRTDQWKVGLRVIESR